MNHFFTETKRNWRYVAVGAVVAVAGCLTLYIVSGDSDYIANKKAQDACRSQYPLISRSIGCVTFDTNSDSIHTLDVQLDTATALYTREGKATRVSIFVRDLVSQQWASSNENEVYAPASLMKLPLLITYYKIAELDPSIFSEKILYPKNSTEATIQDFEPADPLVQGTTYTVQDLITHMIVNSDNVAANLLYSHVNPDIFNQTAIDLGVRLPVDSNTLDFVTAKTYAGIIRMLYNSAYLNRTSSEAALLLMSKTAFLGIAKPLPSSIVVAHKFGERENDLNGVAVTRELHDCGVVYKEPHPYTICIMTEGKNFDDLVGILQNLSLLVYKNM